MSKRQVIDFTRPNFCPTNGIELAYYEAGPASGTPVVLCHGWPEIAYSWRHQIEALSCEGYRVIAPDMRGYGQSSAPLGEAAVPLYDSINLTADLCGLLDHLGIEKAVFGGHDWGGFVVWDMAVRHPSRVMGIIGVNTPYIARTHCNPLDWIRKEYGETMYMVEFQTFGRGEDALGKDTRRSLEFIIRKSHLTAEIWNSLSPRKRRIELLRAVDTPREYWPGEPLFSDEDMQFYVDAFEQSGWEGGINWYRNITRNWETSEGLPTKIYAPCLMISAQNDIILSPALSEGMEEHIPNLSRELIADCGHWTQEEKPGELNRCMLAWLDRQSFKSKGASDASS